MKLQVDHCLRGNKFEEKKSNFNSNNLGIKAGD